MGTVWGSGRSSAHRRARQARTATGRGSYGHVKLAINEIEAARSALEEVWRPLVLEIDRAKDLKAEVAKDPTRANDLTVQAYIRWLGAFERELAAVQTVHESAAVLDLEDIRAARTTAEKLLAAITRARESLSSAS